MLKKSCFFLASLAFSLFTASAEEKQTNQPKDTADMKDKQPTLVEEDIVTLTTSEGVIVIKLDSVNCPKHAENFKKLVKEGFYDGTTFHRVIPKFMIQGGDPKGNGTGGPGYTIPAEIKNKHSLGAVAAARLSDDANPKRDSSGSQFYIVVDEAGCRHLDGEYTVFGQVIEGMDAVNKIVAKPKERVAMKAKLGRPKS